MRRRERVSGEHEAEDERGRRKWKASAALGKLHETVKYRDLREGEMRQEGDNVWGKSFSFSIYPTARASGIWRLGCDRPKLSAGAQYCP